MRYEVVEDQGEWIVRNCGEELARYDNQDAALNDVAERLRDAESGQTASLAVRYQTRSS